MSNFAIMTVDGRPYMRKFWRGKILANMTNGARFAFSLPISTSKIKDLQADLPNFHVLFASLVMIC